MTHWTLIALALALALGCGCGKDDPGPPCTKVAEHVNDVVSKAMPGHGEMMPPSSRKAWVASCEARKLTGKQRSCMMAAQTPDELAACLPKEKPGEKKPEAPAGMPGPAPASPGTPPAGAAPPAPAPPAPAAPAPTPK